MASDQNRTAFKRIDRLLDRGSVTGLREDQLLDRFVAERDDVALEALVEWHRPMVLGVCRRWLANPHDVDDAFQATFLILVRKAQALRDVSRLGPWLHGVAYRVAVRARADAARRRALEQAAARPESDPDIHSPDRLALRAEARGVVDEEIARLPNSLRAAIVLCDLEGQPQYDAARLLGWSEGALRGRLARARQKLRERLERRGIAPGVLPVTGHLLTELIRTSPPRALIDATTRAVMATVLAGRASPSASTVISASVTALAQGVIRAMTLATLKKVSAVTILTAVGFLAAVGFVRAGLLRFEAGRAPHPTVPALAQAGSQTLKAGTEKAKTRTLEFRVVRRSDQQPVAGANVDVSSVDHDSATESTFTTDEHGRCSIAVSDAASRLRISVARDGFVPVTRSWNEPEIGHGVPEICTQELEPGQPIGGFVKDEQGRPIEAADVTVAISQRKDDVPDDDVPSPGNLRVYASFPHIQVKTDAQGRWRCSILPVNADPTTRLWFLVGHPAYVSDTSGYSRRLSLKTVRAMTGALILSSGVNVGGQVRDGDGRPVPGARIVLAYSASPAEALRATTDGAGRFTFAHANNRNGLGRWSLSAEAPGFAPAWTMIVPNGEIPDVVFRLLPGKPFHGRVVDKNGKPVAGAAVSARWEECYHLDWKAVTDADGRFIWPDAPANGNIDFRLQKAGYTVASDRTVSAALGQAELTINAPLRARGKVIDAESKQVVRSFKAIPAMRFRDEREINWDRARAVNGSDGRYEMDFGRFDQPKTVYTVRIESDGYAPATSRPIQPDEGDVTLDFALTKARPTSGVVRLPDGTPAVDAEVYVDGRGISRNPSGPPPTRRLLADHRFKTGHHGRYSIPPGDQPFGIVVVHEKGFGDRSADELAGSADVTLRPWGRIEGTFRIRGKPGIGQQIEVTLNRSVISPRYIFQEYAATTGDQGRFVIERVMDGEANFIWSSGRPAMSTRSSAGPAVDIRAAQTLRVDLGGQGRPLIGRIVLSPAEGVQNDAIGLVSPGNARGWIEIKPAEMPTPADFMTWDTMKRQAYKRTWYRTEQGKTYMRNRRYHSFPVGPDGRFRIEDITPGPYSLSISLSSTAGLTHPLTRNRLQGTIERDVEVAPIPGGQSDLPLDLGTIALKLEVKN
jgi:RNA polymerase sigma factor (sigma-70 family)